MFSEDCLQKMINKKIINSQKNLKDLLLIHLKNMNFTHKLMQNQGTFHVLNRFYLYSILDIQFKENNLKLL